MAIYQFYREQKLPISVEETWDFISSPRNLKEITPDYMGFEVTSEYLEEKMYPGMIISCKVKPVLGIPTLWVTEITKVEDFSFFIDEQRQGPYKMWHHEHRIETIEGGTLMKDLISYIPPMGFLGAIANNLFIEKQIQEIFDYRHQALIKRFGEFKG